MDRIRDNDCDEEVYRIRRVADETDLPTREEIGLEGSAFHDEWSRQNPNSVWGQSPI